MVSTRMRRRSPTPPRRCASGRRCRPACVVVLAGERCRLRAPRERAARTRNLVGCDLLTVSRAAQHYSQAAGIGDGLHRRRDAESRIIVFGVKGVRTAVNRLVPRRALGVRRWPASVRNRHGPTEIDAHSRDSAVMATGNRKALRAARLSNPMPVSPDTANQSMITSTLWRGSLTGSPFPKHVPPQNTSCADTVM
jgi:hypothetical protein